MCVLPSARFYLDGGGGGAGNDIPPGGLGADEEPLDTDFTFWLPNRFSLMDCIESLSTTGWYFFMWISLSSGDKNPRGHSKQLKVGEEVQRAVGWDSLICSSQAKLSDVIRLQMGHLTGTVTKPCFEC